METGNEMVAKVNAGLSVICFLGMEKLTSDCCTLLPADKEGRLKRNNRCATIRLFFFFLHGLLNQHRLTGTYSSLFHLCILKKKIKK